MTTRRNGTTDLFAAMDMATGEVLYDCRRGHTATDVLRFFRLIDAHVPRPLEIHVVLDNLSAHKAPEVRDWLAHPRRRRWHLHFTPTSSSWLNLIERWFKELTDRRLRHPAADILAKAQGPEPPSPEPNPRRTTRAAGRRSMDRRGRGKGRLRHRPRRECRLEATPVHGRGGPVSSPWLAW